MSEDKPLDDIAKEADEVAEDGGDVAGSGMPILSLRYGALIALVIVLFIIASSRMFIDNVLRPIGGTVDAGGAPLLKGQMIQGLCLALGMALLDGALRMGVL